MGDHTETLQLDFDPKQISYEALSKIFWDSHNALGRSYSAQYKAAVFVHHEEQRRINQKHRDSLEAMHPSFQGRICTEILPAQTFYLAEDYHQKYYLQRDKALLAELMRFYPTIQELTRSTAAARLNGLLGEHGEPPSTEEDLAFLGLRPSAARSLPRPTSKQRRL